MTKKELKSVYLLAFLALILVSSTFLLPLISAQTNSTFIECDQYNSLNRLEKTYCVWLGGLTGADNFDLIAEIAKWIFLIIIVLLVYSAFEYVSFPQGGVTRLLLSILIGVGATTLITTKELLTTLLTYNALGVTLSVFLPILVLAFFTLIVASKASPIGIFLQRVIWLIFSIYLFFKAFILWGISNFSATENDYFIYSIAQFLAGGKEAATALATTATKFDTPMLVLLMVVAVAVFFIGFVSNKFIVHWLAKEKMLAEIEGQKELIKRSQAMRKLEAGAMEETGKAAGA